MEVESTVALTAASYVKHSSFKTAFLVKGTPEPSKLKACLQYFCDRNLNTQLPCVVLLNN